MTTGNAPGSGGRPAPWWRRGRVAVLLGSALAGGVLLGVALGLAYLGLVPTPEPSAPPASPQPVASDEPATPDPGRPVAEVPASIDQAGESDVTDELQAFLDGTPDGSTIVLRPGARYLVEDVLLLERRRDLVIDGRGAVIFSVERAGRPVWRLVGSSAILFTGLTISGANDRAGTPDAYLPDVQHEHAFDLRGASDVEIRGVTMEGQNGDCLYVGPDSAGNWSERIALVDSTCRSNGRMGVAITAGRDVRVEGNRFDEIAIYTIDIEPNESDRPQGAERVLVADNEVGTGSHSDAYTPYFFAANGWGIATDVTIRDNVLTGQALWMTADPKDSPFHRARFTITGNRSDTVASGREVLRLARHEDLVVTGNVQPVDGDGPFALVTESCRIRVTDNDLGGGGEELEVRDEGCPT